jgi:SAM-dependent methyltransferase
LCEREQLERILVVKNRVYTETQLRRVFQPSSNDNSLYSEHLLQEWGAESVESIDYSHFEGATHVVDLNGDLPASLVGRYDSIIDCGTMEHVFDVARAISNILRLAKPGGWYIACLPANNCMGHGFYQLSPEFLYGVLVAENGFEVELVLLSEIRGTPTFYIVPNPTVLGRRVELCTTWGLSICACKANWGMRLALLRTSPTTLLHGRLR